VTCVAAALALAGCSGTEGGDDGLASAASAGATAARAPGGGGDEPTAKTETAVFGAGCFWGVESTFRKVPGVLRTESGYAGGTTERPTYEEVCNEPTGHAEVVRVEYDPAKVGYQKLLEVFFENHDPTTLNRQGPDVGTQYRSVVFFQSPEQEALARAEKERRDASGDYVGPIVTEIQPAPPFWPAEGYHQQYFEKQGVDWVCHTGNGKKRGK
jgi:peptide-methionine (S)-S-oxide reductase